MSQIPIKYQTLEDFIMEIIRKTPKAFEGLDAGEKEVVLKVMSDELFLYHKDSNSLYFIGDRKHGSD